MRKNANMESRLVSIKLYCKKDCPPCAQISPIASKKFRSSRFQEIILGENQEMLDELARFNVKSVPFLVINDNVVIQGRDLQLLLISIAY